MAVARRAPRCGRELAEYEPIGGARIVVVRTGWIAFMFVQLTSTVARSTCGVVPAESHSPCVAFAPTHSRLRPTVKGTPST